MLYSLNLLFEMSRDVNDCYLVPIDLSFLKHISEKPPPVIAKLETYNFP